MVQVSRRKYETLRVTIGREEIGRSCRDDDDAHALDSKPPQAGGTDAADFCGDVLTGKA